MCDKCLMCHVIDLMDPDTPKCYWVKKDYSHEVQELLKTEDWRKTWEGQDYTSIKELYISAKKLILY